MAVISTESQHKQRAVIFFEKGNDANIKNFASRVRIDNNVEATLVWSYLFSVDDMPLADAVIIELGARQAGNIEAAYRRVLPDIEVHYVNSEGDWAQKDAKDKTEPESVIPSAKTKTRASTRKKAEKTTSTPHAEVVKGTTDDSAGEDPSEFRRADGYAVDKVDEAGSD